MIKYHRVNASRPRYSKPALPIGKKAVHIVRASKARQESVSDWGTNKSFLDAIFSRRPEQAYVWTCSFTSDPKDASPELRKRWAGKGHAIEETVDHPKSNSYFSVSLFNEFEIDPKRRKEKSIGMFVVVLDDVVGTLLPSWVIETSDNNYQTGYILANPITDLDLATRLLEEITNKGGVNKNDINGNNVVRYVRLPVGTNTKEGLNFQHQLREFRPDTTYTLDELIAGLGLDREYVINGAQRHQSSSNVISFDNYGMGVDVQTNLKAIRSGEHFHNQMRDLVARWLALGLPPSEVKAIAESFMNSIPVDERRKNWKNDVADIGYLIETAVKKGFNKPKSSKRDPLVDQETGERIDILEVFKPYDYCTTKLTPPTFVIDGFLSAEIFTIAGEAGVGKTSLLVPLVAIAAHLCRSDEPLKPKLRRKVVYMTEDPAQVERILYALRAHWRLKITDDQMKEWFTVIPVHRSEKEVLAELIRVYARLNVVEQQAKNGMIKVPPLFVFDTAAASFSLESENDNAEVSAAISICKKACFEMSVPLFIIAHIPKNVSRTDMKSLSARGAGAWTGDVNGTAFIGKNEGGSNTRYMWLGKRRYEPNFDTLVFEAHRGSVWTEDILGDLVEIPYIYGTPKQSSTQERVDDAVKTKAEGALTDILIAMRESEKDGVYMNRTSLKSALKDLGNGAKVKAVELAIERGLIEEFENLNAPKNSSNKRALRLTELGGKHD